MPPEAKQHGTRKVRKGDPTVTVSIPLDAVEHSGIEPGEQVMVGSLEDGEVVLKPWSEEDVREMLTE